VSAMAVEAVSGNVTEAVAAAPAKEVSTKQASFREESNFLDDLKESERKALAELRDKVEAAIVEGKLFDDGKPEVKEKEKEKEEVKKKAVEKKDEQPEAEEKGEEDGKKEADADEEKKEGVEEGEKKEGQEEGEKEEAEEESGDDTKQEAKKEEAGEKAAAKEPETAAVVVDKDIALWGVPLLPSKGDEATDVVLLKFLRARDFKAGAAFEMLRRTLRWRRDWTGFGSGAECDADADLPEELAGACYLDGADHEGHPVCYNALGVFADDAVYKKALGTEEGKARFLRWRVRAMERHVAELDLRPGGVASLLQVIDLRNSPGPAKKDFRVAVKQVLDLFQDNYPELVARNVSVVVVIDRRRSGRNSRPSDLIIRFLCDFRLQILINVPFWYYAFSTLFYPFLTQRTKSKFVVARPSKVTETLLK
jgi:hypothetical protein